MKPIGELHMADGEAILTAIRQAGVLSLTFGLAMLIAAVAIGFVLRNTVKIIARDATARRLRRPRQIRTVRRIARAIVLFAMLVVTTVFGASHLLDSGAWLAANAPEATLARGEAAR
jgi:F0F1-type ATP synthase membrane subunit c/vacuolar-type H+-ATPase subunit K